MIAHYPHDKHRENWAYWSEYPASSNPRPGMSTPPVKNHGNIFLKKVIIGGRKKSRAERRKKR